MTDVIPLIPEAPATFADDAADIGALAAQGETPPNERNRKSVSQRSLKNVSCALPVKPSLTLT